MSTVQKNEDGRPVHAGRMIKPLIIVVLAAAVLLGGILGWQAFIGSMTKKYMGALASAPQTVSTVKASRTEWQPRLQAIGTLRAVRGADLSSQVSGIVDDIEFDSGNEVPKGKLLLRLKLNDEYAKLQQLQASAQLYEQTLKRDQEQFAAQAVSQATIDTDVSNVKYVRAEIAAQQALIEEKIVKAPFAGRLGIRQVDVGQYLTAGAAVVTLQALDPMLIDFYVPQQALKRLTLGQSATATLDAYPGEQFSGVIESINSKIDGASRNLQVRASFRNADRRLLPGMFANVAIDSGPPGTEVTVPQTCITYNPYGDTVYVVKHGAADASGKTKDTVQQRFVTLGATRGDQIAVLKGLDAGEEVVSAGQMKLRNGASVTINNALQPLDDAHPTPPNE